MIVIRHKMTLNIINLTIMWMTECVVRELMYSAMRVHHGTLMRETHDNGPPQDGCLIVRMAPLFLC